LRRVVEMADKGLKSNVVGLFGGSPHEHLVS
jgi:hypothetical protein